MAQVPPPAAAHRAGAAALLAEGQRLYAAGEVAAALQRANEALELDAGLAGAWQLAAIVERRLGRHQVARGHFERALQAAPDDPHILNSFGNLLSDLGEPDEARRCYELALAADPGHSEARVNLAGALKRLGLRSRARSELQAVLDAAPGHGRAWHALGLLLFEEGEHEAAAAALDRTLELQPANLSALRLRGEVAGEIGEPGAPYYARARRLAPNDRSLALGEALAHQKAGEPEAARARLEALVESDPTFGEAHAALARLSWQGGDAQGFARHFEGALARHPEEPGLWWSYFGVLMLAQRHSLVLELLPRARRLLGGMCDGLEAVAASEAGELATADEAFRRLDLAADPGLQVGYLRHLLRAGRPEAAASFAEARVATAGGAAAWPYLATAWRMLGDPRWAWLEGDPAFVRTFDLPIEALDDLADCLRGLHRSRAAPLDQTLRGGTQTEGSLLSRREPEIVRLRQTLAEAVAAYIAQLPSPDERHPLLSPPRNGFRFAGSWSVLLAASGFHVNHVHVASWISSAFYVVLPDEVGRVPAEQRGWLTFGEPPAELGLGLGPFGAVEPRPGRLALFPSTMWHGTRRFDAGERLTVAFDIAPRL